MPPNFQTLPKELNNEEIENIIFDLGGVIINLHIEATFQKFAELFKSDFSTEAFTDHIRHHFFKDYEVGKISSDEFRDRIREVAGSSISYEKIDEAWNAMLLDIPEDRIKWIYEATQNYNCVVLSNTNSIHINHFEYVFEQSTPYGHPASFFQKLFYSHEIGHRKPNAAAFQHVLDEMGFDPSKTVLFDDLKENLEAAKQLGIQTVYVERNKLRREQLLNGRI